jgi:3-mercaptopyruvate sulfurtransferase SseA
MGFRSVCSIAGGFDAWQAAGYPVDKPADVSFE